MMVWIACHPNLRDASDTWIANILIYQIRPEAMLITLILFL